ncbi:coniferyl aldehyde dehydrogenase [Pseudoalteromonas mariniglutinosa]|uniref:coniferyl aldehyde dehydrogenase n=1 Tax=Pseudoalteromonas mariniglutinosa TaxID=206042 RepID=UPI00384BE82F
MSVEKQQLNEQFNELKAQFSAQPYPDIKQRIRLLKQLKSQLIAAQDALTDACSKDFGYRTSFDTILGDLLPTVKAITDLINHLPTWSRASKRAAGISLWPSKVLVNYQPKGVVGVVAPWNYPIQLALIPVVTALAAGNRVMLKLSEYTPHTNAVLQQIVAQSCAKDVTLVEGNSQLAAQFTSLPFAHLLFTGSTHVGKQVMSAASKNLTPVTLELGGKSPVIILPDANIKTVAKTLLFGKLTNAGQICVAPDYVWVPETMQHQLIQQLCELYRKHFKQGVEAKNLTSIISAQHYQRLCDYLHDAENLGGQIINPLTVTQQDALKHRLGLHLITNVNEQMKVMQEEIFGPVLPILSYRELGEAVNYINDHAHPLALYVLGHDRTNIEYISQVTQSGTFAVNDMLMQVTAEQVPFGGIGESGMGHYHGIEGFKTFSHARNTLLSGKFNPRIGLLLKQYPLLVKLLTWWYLRK